MQYNKESTFLHNLQKYRQHEVSQARQHPFGYGVLLPPYHRFSHMSEDLCKAGMLEDAQVAEVKPKNVWYLCC
jgi:hypothetical protein